MSVNNIDIREKDKLDDAKIEVIALNWNIPEEEDLPILQKIMLYCLSEIKNLKIKIKKLEERR